MANYGHFGRPAFLLAVATGIALVAHLVMPYGVIDYRGPAAPDDNALFLGEAYDLRDVQTDATRTTNASPAVALSGIIVMGLGAAILMTLGFQPLTVVAARWIGAAGGLIALIGAGLTVMSSMYSVGTGFSTMLGTLMGSEFRTNFWAVSPVVVAGASLFVAWQAMQVMTKVVAVADGLRDEATAHLHIVRAAFVLLALTLLVPWSIGLLPDGLSDRFGTGFGDDTSPLFFSAEDVQGATLAESALDGRLRFNREGDWDFLSAAIHVHLAVAWSAIVLGGLGALTGVARSTGAPANLGTPARMTWWLIAVSSAALLLLFVLSLILFKPDSASDETFLPGFMPIVVAMAAGWTGLQAMRLARGEIEAVQGGWSKLSRPTETP